MNLVNTATSTSAMTTHSRMFLTRIVQESWRLQSVHATPIRRPLASKYISALRAREAAGLINRTVLNCRRAASDQFLEAAALKHLDQGAAARVSTPARPYRARVRTGTSPAAGRSHPCRSNLGPCRTHAIDRARRRARPAAGRRPAPPGSRPGRTRRPAARPSAGYRWRSTRPLGRPCRGHTGSRRPGRRPGRARCTRAATIAPSCRSPRA